MRRRRRNLINLCAFVFAFALTFMLMVGINGCTTIPVTGQEINDKGHGVIDKSSKAAHAIVDAVSSVWDVVWGTGQSIYCQFANCPVPPTPTPPPAPVP